MECLSEIPFKGPVSLTFDLYPPDGRKRDIDNVLKPVLDALEARKVFKNDNQVARLTVTRREISKPDGYIAGTVENYEAP